MRNLFTLVVGKQGWYLLTAKRVRILPVPLDLSYLRKSWASRFGKSPDRTALKSHIKYMLKTLF